MPGGTSGRCERPPARALGRWAVRLAGQVRAISPEGVDAILHLAGDGAALTGLLAENGRLASTLGVGVDQHPAAVAVVANPVESTLDRLAADASVGRITVPVSRSYSLSDVPTAFADFAAGTVGKLVVVIA
ncbi:MAG TPA: zinc-binding dehydrogenase [Micromonosporaceae bacterium]